MLGAAEALTDRHPDDDYNDQKDSKNHQFDFHVLQPCLPTNFHPLFLELLSLNYIYAMQVMEGKQHKTGPFDKVWHVPDYVDQKSCVGVHSSFLHGPKSKYNKQ